MTSSWKSCWSWWYEQSNTSGVFTWALTSTVLSNKSFFKSWNLPWNMERCYGMSFVSNYRPISLLSCLEKVAERAIIRHLYNHLHENSILTPLQSGFIPGDYLTNQLTYLYDTFPHTLDSDKEIRVVFCDISKAFDLVWHQGILLKLRAAGVTGKLLPWFRSYLSNRRQQVVLPGASSNWNLIFADMPQGSILVSLLFLLYIYSRTYQSMSKYVKW